MIKAIIVIVILIFIAYGVLEILYRMYIRDRQSMENDILNLEQRVEQYNNNLKKEINSLKNYCNSCTITNGFLDAIKNLNKEKKGKKK